MVRFWKIASTAALLFIALSWQPRRAEAIFVPAPISQFDDTLSVLTYNVEGLPWPVARGRVVALDRIGETLRAMRIGQREPHVVVLQEAFTAEAQSIGTIAGYPYVVRGPDADMIGRSTPPPADRGFAAAARWWKGETEGKYLGSGLEVLSDYPVIAVRRMAYPAFACAGYDCLANKGALMVRIAPPGSATPVDIVVTHLNSRRASGVEPARSFHAYGLQVAALTDFVRRVHDPRYPLIAAGDFNVASAARRALLLGDAHAKWGAGHPVKDALTVFRDSGARLSADIAYSLNHAKDWQFYANGGNGRLSLSGVAAPFGHDAAGAMLSDHVGYVARFRILPRATTSSA